MARASELRRGGRAATQPALVALAALVASGALAGVTVPGCTAVLDVDDYQSADGALCEKIERCYALADLTDCSRHVKDGLELDQKQREQWLVDFSRDACLSSCVAARSCLDADPVCSRRDCGAIEDCCGFSTGKALCENGACCAPKGVACGPGSPCCAGQGPCAPNNICGGTPCLDGGAACDDGAQCCTGQCVNGACLTTKCNPPGFECDTGDNCCLGLICDTTGTCAVPASCKDIGAVCLHASDCCQTSDAQLFCFQPGGVGAGVCSTCGGALPAGAECFTDADCCANLRCDPAALVCVAPCSPLGITCGGDGECCSGNCASTGAAPVCQDPFCSDDDCAKDEDCCSGKCLPGGACAVTCRTGCDHDVCDPGGALDGSCMSTPTMPVHAACASAVCAVDPYCCCQAWDEICVGRASGAIDPALPACANACD